MVYDQVLERDRGCMCARLGLQGVVHKADFVNIAIV